MGSTQIPFVVPTVRLRYDNYDLWPPELTFIDLFTGLPAPPPIPATVPHPSGARTILIDRPSNRFFLCVPGTRGYHTDSEHDGDVWHRYRAQRRGSLAVICETVSDTMTRTVAGVGVQIQQILVLPGPSLPVAEAQRASSERRAAYDAAVTEFAAGARAADET
jgi:hypothetical protein